MYAPSANRVSDQAEATAFVDAHPFAMLCVNGPDGPVIAHVPLVSVKDGEGRLVELIGHVARANPFHELIEESGTPVVAVFRGADAYVSPSFYPSKQEHGKVVPTWNYLAAEARGTIFIDRDAANMLDYLVPLTNQMESHRPVPWAVNDAPADYLSMMTRAIVGLKIKVSHLTGKRKISQGKSDADYSGVVNAFAASDNPNENKLSVEMTKESAAHS
jgi:transcriptional regulator